MKKINKRLINFFLILFFFFAGASFVNADTIIGDVTVTVLPTVTTSPVSSITQTTATSGGNVTNDGGSAVTERGIVWNTSTGPTISNNKIINGTGTGSFTSNLTGLTTGTTYYLRAYATSSIGTSYGDNVSFQTSAIEKKNLSLTQSGTGSGVISASPISCGAGCSDYQYNPDQVVTLSATPNINSTFSGWSGNSDCWDGALTMDVDKSCTATFVKKTYSVYLYPGPGGSVSSNVQTVDYGGTATFTITPNSGYKIQSVTGCSVSLSGSYETGLTANVYNVTSSCNMSAYFIQMTGSLSSNPSCTIGYSSSTCDINLGWAINNPIGNETKITANGFSDMLVSSSFEASQSGSKAISIPEGTTIFYLYNNSILLATSTATATKLAPVVPTVTTSSVSSITQTTAIGGGTTVSDGGSTVTQAGLVWSTLSNPTISNNLGKTYNGWASGGPWTSNITGLSMGTTYHVRSYATNSIGTSYGADISFTTQAPLNCTSTPWGNMINGTSNTAYLYSSVSYPSSCTPQVRTCTNGVLSGTYTNPSCSVNPILPTVVTQSCSTLTNTSIRSYGGVNSNGGGTVTQAGIIWDTSSNPTENLSTKTSHYNWADYSAWSDDITGLSDNTTYYIRAYAKNEAGTSYGSSISCKTLSIPVITNIITKNITQTGATIEGTLSHLGDPKATSTGSSYGLSESTLSNTITNTFSGSQPITISRILTGLTPNTKYYFNIFATNTMGTGSGANSFTTLPLPSGSLTPNPSSCTITTGNSSCSINLGWELFNPETIPTSITATGFSVNVSNSLSAYQSGTQLITIPYTNSPKTFYLYNNSRLLDEVTISSVCNIPTDKWNGSICVPNTHTVTASTVNLSVTGGTNSGGTITPISKVANYSEKISLTITPDVTNGYYLYSVGGTCGGTLSGNIYTTNPVTTDCTVIANFKINNYNLSVSKIGTGTGSINFSPVGVSCGNDCYSYDHSSSVTLTAVPNSTDSFFEGWTGCDSVNVNGQCVLNIKSIRNVTSKFTKVEIGVTPSPMTYNIVENGNVSVSFSYTTTTNTEEPPECTLLDSNQNELNGIYKQSSPILHLTPQSPGSYGYFIKCRDMEKHDMSIISGKIIVNVIGVSVFANTPYNKNPGESISFVYTSNTNPQILLGMDPSIINGTECRLLDFNKNILVPESAYQLYGPIIYNAPNTAPGSYGYYVECRNRILTTAKNYSGLITVNTFCPALTIWDEETKKCTSPTGTLTATPNTCEINEWESSCNSSTKLNWSVKNPISVPVAITSNGMSDINLTTNLTTPQSGIKYATVKNAGPHTFYLYNSSIELANAQVNASCKNGTTWDIENMRCEPPTGYIGSSGCNIAVNKSNCDVSINWNTRNPLSGIESIIKTPTETGSTIGSGNNGTIYNYNIDLGSTNFFLMYNGKKLAESSSIASCANKTHWEGGVCKLNNPEIASFEAIPSTVFLGQSFTLKWDADPDLSTFCTGTGTGFEGSHTQQMSGKLILTPLVTTEYSLTCGRTDGTPNVVKKLIVKVVELDIQEN